jgi:8-oxo-dGTP pyrophosphatase MutT (NUDIX family)
MRQLDLDWIRAQLAGHRPSTIEHETAPRRAAVAIILRSVDDGADTSCECLFIHRAVQSDDPWSGHMAFPGGRLEESDPSLLHAARRETLEEVGIDLERDGELLGAIDELRASARGRVLPMAISPFVFALAAPVTTRCSEEVAESVWVPLRQLLDPGSASTVPYVLEGQRFDLPCFRISGHVIWGLTYQMVMRFFALLDDSAQRV